MKLHVDIQSASAEPVPGNDDIRRWVAAALAGSAHTDEAGLCVRLVDRAEMCSLNETYRNKQGTTNVLSFPADLPSGVDLPLLGDIVICAPVVREEAAMQGKSNEAHWAHMAVHGTLHLLGFDHEDGGDAAAMERMEADVLAGLGKVMAFTSSARPTEQGTRQETCGSQILTRANEA